MSACANKFPVPLNIPLFISSRNDLFCMLVFAFGKVLFWIGLWQTYNSNWISWPTSVKIPLNAGIRYSYFILPLLASAEGQCRLYSWILSICSFGKGPCVFLCELTLAVLNRSVIISATKSTPSAAQYSDAFCLFYQPRKSLVFWTFDINSLRHV